MHTSRIAPGTTVAALAARNAAARGVGRNNANPPVFWLAHGSPPDAEDLPEADVLAAKIAEDPGGALQQFASIANALKPDPATVRSSRPRLCERPGTPRAGVTVYASPMCGRFTHKYTWAQLHRLLNLVSPPFEFTHRFNVAPTQRAPVVRACEEASGAGGPGPGRRVDLLRWGFIPSWARDESFGARTINARAETAATSRVFRDSFRHRRCLVPVSGFYEWRKMSGSTRKQAYYITSSDADPLMLAGLWSAWKSSDGPMETFTILTTTPNEMMARLHDRMPVILGAEDWAAWLGPAKTPEDGLSGLLRPYPSELMLAYPVSNRVNNPKNDDPTCIQAVAEQRLPENEEPGLFS